MNQSTVKLLHVEDDATDAMITLDLLHESSHRTLYQVDQVESLKDALGKLRAEGYDAVLLDLNLSDITGIDNVAAIVHESPDTPIVVLTAIDNDQSALEAIDHGAQEYLVKGHCDGKVMRLAIRSSIRRKAVERQLFKQANFDELTGLPNRRLFRDYVEKALMKARRWERSETLMFVDMDNFKAVNDSLGHDAGNALLKEVAVRMSSTLRESDLVARYGGDEFTVLLDDQSKDTESAAAQAASKLMDAFKAPFYYGESRIDFSASIGIGIFPDAGLDYARLLKAADLAMYDAKRAGGRGFRFAQTHNQPESLPA